MHASLAAVHKRWGLFSHSAVSTWVSTPCVGVRAGTLCLLITVAVNMCRLANFTPCNTKCHHMGVNTHVLLSIQIPWVSLHSVGGKTTRAENT